MLEQPSPTLDHARLDNPASETTDCSCVPIHPVVVLSHYFWPEQMATAELLSGIVFALREQGFPFEVIAGQPAYWNSGTKEDNRLASHMEHNGVKILRVRSTRLNKNTTIGRILNTLTFTLSSIWAALRTRQPSAFLAVTNPPLLPWVACLAASIRGIPCMIVVHDVYPQIGVALGRIRSWSPLNWLWRSLNRWVYRHSERIIVLGDCMAEVIRAELPSSQADKVVIIPNWSDGDLIQPRDRAGHPLIGEWGLQDRFVVQYSGNIGLFHEIRTLLEAARLLKDWEPKAGASRPIHFVFIGEGGQLPWARDFIAAHNLTNVTLLPIQPIERLPLTLTACDIGLVTLKSEATGLCVPSKLYGILAAGRPVLGVLDSSSETARAIARHQCGVITAPGDAAALASLLLQLRDQPGACSHLANAARRAYEQHYNLNAVTEQYRRVMEILP